MIHNNQHVVVNWTVTVINELRLPPVLLMMPCIPSPAHRRGRGLPWRMDKISAVRRLSRRLLDRSKKRNFYLPPHAFGAMLGVIPLKFRRDLLHHNKTVSSSAVVLRNCFQDHAFNNFSSTPTCDGRTNGSDAVSSGGGGI